MYISTISNLIILSYIKSEKQSEVDQCNGQDHGPEEDSFEAVAEILLLEKTDRIGPPDEVGNEGRMVRPNKYIFILS